MSMTQRRLSHTPRRSSAFVLAKLAMASAIQGVDSETDCQPGEESQPGQDRQSAHQEPAEKDAEHRRQDSSGRAEPAMPARIAVAQNNDADGDQHESKQRADVRQIGKRPNISNARRNPNHEAGNPS